MQTFPGGLNPGTYRVVESPPTGYANEDVQILPQPTLVPNQQLNPAVRLDSKTIEVTVIDPSHLTVTLDNGAFSRNKWVYADYNFFGSSQTNSIGQFPLKVTTPDQPSFSATFLSLCDDLGHDLSGGTTVDTFPVLPSPNPGPTDRSG